MTQPSPNERFDLAVVGIGLIGSAALRHAANAGLRVVGVGPAEPAEFATHEGLFASHYDSGRITRYVDPTFEWAVLASRAIAEYPVLEAASGISFHHPVGVIYAAKSPAIIAETDQVVARLGTATTRTEVNSDSRMSFADGTTLFIEGGPAGFINPRRMIAAQLLAAERSGAVVHRTIVESIAAVGGGWELKVADGSTIRAERVVVAGGPHTDELPGLPVVPHLDVRPETIVQAVIDEDEQQRLAGLPSILSPEPDPFDDFYLVPPALYPDGTVRVKLGATLTGPTYMRTRAERLAWMRSDEHLADLAPLRGITERLLPGLRALRWETRPCLITDTPTNLPYIDHAAEGLVLTAGCNGYAGKSADAIGAVAAQLAIEARWTDTVLDAERFRLIARV